MRFPKAAFSTKLRRCLAAAGIRRPKIPEKSRKLIIGTGRADVRLIIVRASDVPTYVQYGAADMGIAGKDVLIEHGGEGMYEPLDLNIARCKMMVATRADFDYAGVVSRGARLKVVTKYMHAAREHFAAKGMHVDLIKLYGSMELGPLVGLADAIVDLVSTGSTLKANNLVAVEEIMPMSSRLIVNRAALKLKRNLLQPIIDMFAKAVCNMIAIKRPEQRGRRFPGATHAADRVRRRAGSKRSTRPSRQFANDVKAARRCRCASNTRASFDGLKAASMADLELMPKRAERGAEQFRRLQRDALEQAAERIRVYHEKQKMSSWQYTESDGTVLGQQVTALDRVGLVCPGGKAAYPSSLLMNVIPAKVAGVGELILTTPTPNGERNALVLAAAAISGVDRVFTIGGAQAVAALAYGTQTIAQVDKICGPGNAYVAAAKRRVFGVVGIDMVAGPSEILVICDGNTDPDWIAMDLFSQAEHDEIAQAILLCPDAEFIERVAQSIEKLLQTMPRGKLSNASLDNRGALIQVRDLDEACAIANEIAPEHLELSVENPEHWTEKIKHAGAIFMGRFSSESLGDYCAGPNHVLPTSRSARFSSPLGVYDFQKRTSIINVSQAGAKHLGQHRFDFGERRRLARPRARSRIALQVMSKFWSDIVRDLTPYVPGEQPKVANLIKLNTNENPYGPSPKVLAALQAEIGDTCACIPIRTATNSNGRLPIFMGVSPNRCSLAMVPTKYWRTLSWHC